MKIVNYCQILGSAKCPRCEKRFSFDESKMDVWTRQDYYWIEVDCPRCNKSVSILED